MALYIVVHHRDDEQTWANAWLDDSHLEAIQTNKQVAAQCQKVLVEHGVLYVNRCAFRETPPTICCSLQIESVAMISASTWLIRFKNQQPLNASPPFHPGKGQNWYEA